MGQERRVYLQGRKVYGCKLCRTHLSSVENLMSKKFNGQHGQAFLFHTCLNVVCGPPEDRSMTTGLHTVRDLRCVRCNGYLGWKYDKAYEPSQKYKENHFILERKLLTDVTPVSPLSSPSKPAGSSNGPASSAAAGAFSSSPATAAGSVGVGVGGSRNGHARTASDSTAASMSTEEEEEDDEDDED